MDPWNKLDEKIKEARKKSVETDAVFESIKLSKCQVCNGRMRAHGTDKLKCEDCGHEILNSKAKIRKALEENPGLTALELSQVTGVPRAEISALLDDGFLELSKKSIGFLKCTICGVQILHGTVCAKCKSTYNAEFSGYNVREGRSVGTIKTESTESTSKMHFANRKRDPHK